MRIAAVGDVHGRENLAALASDLDRLGPVDLLLLAGDITDRNDLEAYGAVLRAIRDRTAAPIAAVFGNNEYAQDHPTYIARYADAFRVRFLQDEAATWGSGPDAVRVVGSLGSLDRPTWWQRRNAPHLADEYRRRIGVLDGLLGGADRRVLLTHYPPTYVTMGREKEEWQPELGCKALEPVLLRRRPNLVIHGHIHKGIPEADLRPTASRLDDFVDGAASVRIHNVAWPVRRGVGVFDLGSAGL
ncbi:MAG TPA: metallophosphoesterase [Thermoplasmata archaeon]|jgi:Icc-related predicted phosphoesterase|nr:metallophosphoesterase [Thermoplasmata archaeon]